MKSVCDFIHKREKGFFTKMEGNFELFNKIVEDMKMSSGNLSPCPGWHFMNGQEEDIEKINARYHEGAYSEIFSNWDKLLDAWIGSEGMQNVNYNDIEKWRTFLSRIDHIGLFSRFLKEKDNFDYKLTDLGSILDVNLIGGLIEQDTNKKHLNILEVGGGYGRLAEAIMNVYQGQVKYVMLDVVPSSLMFAYLYMKKCHPQLKIGYYYNDDDFDMDKFDLYVMPAWHFEKLNNIEYDVTINIESMQEMNQFHVDYYLNLFDKITKKDGLIYISNAHDYKFKGNWNYPENWEKLMAFNTPRSWSPNHPTEVFAKRKKSYKIKNSFIDAGFEHQLNKQFKLIARYNDLEARIKVIKHYLNPTV